MSDIKEETLQSEPGAWHRVCELAALPEQAGRSAWLEGRGVGVVRLCLLYTTPGPRDGRPFRMPSSA